MAERGAADRARRRRRYENEPLWVFGAERHAVRISAERCHHNPVDPGLGHRCDGGLGAHRIEEGAERGLREKAAGSLSK